MHQKDFDLLSGALALEHHDAVAHGPRHAVAQAEHIALTIAEAIAREHRTFDPVKFMLAACQATTVEQLTPPIREQLTTRFGTSEPRPRLRSERHRGLEPDEMINTSWWTEQKEIGMMLREVSRSVGVASAEGHLMNAGIRTLGQLLATSDEELRAIPGLRLGPVTLEAIRKVKTLWHAKQQSAPETVAARAEFPEPIPLATPGATARAAQRRPAGRDIPRRGYAPGA